MYLDQRKKKLKKYPYLSPNDTGETHILSSVWAVFTAVYCCVYCLLLCAPCRPSPRSRPRPRWTTSRRCTTSTTARRSSCSATTPRAPASGSRYVELNFRCCRSNIQKKSYFFTALYRICHWGWVITVYCTFWLPLYWSWSWSSCYSLFLALPIFRQASPVLMLGHLIFRVFELKWIVAQFSVAKVSYKPIVKLPDYIQ